MRKAISCLGPLLLVAIVLAGCGGGMSSTLTPSGTKVLHGMGFQRPPNLAVASARSNA